MPPILDLDIRPGLGLGQFELGMPPYSLRGAHANSLAGSSLWTVMDQLRRPESQNCFPQVDVKFDPDSPTTPVILHLRPHLDLLFSGQHQRLHTICLRRLRDPHPPVILRYRNSVLSSSSKDTEQVLRRVGVSRAFGPTYAGDDLRYPGVWFSFEEDGIQRRDSLKGGRERSPQPEDKMQEVKRVIVSQKSESDTEEEADVLSEVRECAVMHGDIRQAIVKVSPVCAHRSPDTYVSNPPGP